jgi:hypothetical protein
MGDGWHATCKACGSFGISGDGKYQSEPAQAIENLSKAPSKLKDKSCPHHYGQYKPRVICYMDYKHLHFLKHSSFSKQGCEKFPTILIDNKYHVSVRNAPELTIDWSAYSYVRHQQLVEQETKRQKELECGERAMREAIAESANAVRELALECDVKSAIETPNFFSAPFKYLLYISLTLVCGKLGYYIKQIPTE